jgi:hypothetical protein
MSPLRALALLALCTPLAAAGCSADDASIDDDVVGEEEGPAEQEVRSTLLGNVAAVKINGGKTVAAPAKVKRILENIGLEPGAARPDEGGFRCLPSYRLEIFKANGETQATAGFLCGGPGAADRRNAKGSIQVGGKSYLISAKDVDALDAIAAEPLMVGDVLFGTDNVVISKPGREEKTTVTDGAGVAKLVKAIQPDQVPNPQAVFPRCLPSRVVTYKNGTKDLASISFSCREGIRATVTGSFSGRAQQAHGAVKISTGAVFDAETRR